MSYIAYPYTIPFLSLEMHVWLLSRYAVQSSQKSLNYTTIQKKLNYDHLK